MGWCEDMRKITPAKLLRLLEGIETSPAEDVDEHIKIPARIALERMLQVCS
jgi:quinolinate synthase